ncbi:hypothetical protein L195_g063839, partial [Trifolium pratense]
MEKRLIDMVQEYKNVRQKVGRNVMEFFPRY